MRFRIPADLIRDLGLTELRRSLGTSDAKVARERCRQATLWFHELIDACRMSEQSHRAAFEKAARHFFEQLRAETELPVPRRREEQPVDLVEQQDLGNGRIDALNEQLVSGAFDRIVMVRARALATEIGVEVETLSDDARRLLKSLTARAELEAVRYHLHRLGDPVAAYTPHDALFQGHAPAPYYGGAPMAQASPADFGLTLADAAEAYVRQRRGVLAEQTIVESVRVLVWFREHYGDDVRLKALDRARLREFRDALIRLSKGHQGKGGLAFASRQTDSTDHRISTKTANKYWSFIQSFFTWAEREGHVEANPTVGLRIEIAKADEGHSPEPFSTDEVRRLLSTPLYSGHQGKLLNKSGTDLTKGAQYWTGLIGLFTGARAGEIAQLLTTDIHFDGPIPYISFRYEDSQGNRTKTLKTRESERDVPIAPPLIALGFQAWVQQRRKLWGEQRLMREVRLGKNGDMSDGMSKFWGNHLRKHGLWKKGRSTHVWRHTVTDILRDAGFSNEMINGVVGHKDQSMTGRYGRGATLKRNAEIVAKIDYGFDMVALLRAHEAALASGKRAGPTPADQDEAEITVINPAGMADHDDGDAAVDPPVAD